MKTIHLFTAAAWLALASTPTQAADAPLFMPQWLGAQYTFVDQHQSSLHSPYSGPLSLRARGDSERSQQGRRDS